MSLTMPSLSTGQVESITMRHLCNSILTVVYSAPAMITRRDIIFSVDFQACMLNLQLSAYESQKHINDAFVRLEDLKLILKGPSSSEVSSNWYGAQYLPHIQRVDANVVDDA